MGSSNSQATQAQLIARIQELIAGIPTTPQEDREQLRDEVLKLAEAMSAIRRLAKLRVSGVSTANAGMKRMLAYLQLFVGEKVKGEELEVVGAVDDYQRRVRQLRVEEGYRISTGTTRSDLRPDEYVLEEREPDLAVAEKWRTANEIKRSKASARDKMLALLKANIKKPVTLAELRYVTSGKDMRRVRELRTEYGWRVATRNTGRPDLASGEYVLESDQQLPEHDRKITDEVYDEVLRRDKLSCRKCGWNVKMREESERRQFLEVHHVKFHHEGGDQNPANLITVCNVHHDDIHRRKLTEDVLWDWLKQHA